MVNNGHLLGWKIHAYRVSQNNVEDLERYLESRFQFLTGDESSEHCRSMYQVDKTVMWYSRNKNLDDGFVRDVDLLYFEFGDMDVRVHADTMKQKFKFLTGGEPVNIQISDNKSSPKKRKKL